MEKQFDKLKFLSDDSSKFISLIRELDQRINSIRKQMKQEQREEEQNQLIQKQISLQEEKILIS
jgi:hypothetical protein